ncbi:MAG: hypothetical protein KGO53_08130 [Alphaproteobacteria bacterium]|nr:hypothetical protein [Alphaproteobacteria bacterium]
MVRLEQPFPESLDEILEAVKETPRGRWFLEGYEARLRQKDTGRILESIAKLENHIQSLGPTNADTALVKRAREAIATARRSIAAIPDKPASLSVEGQMFARLASLSKDAFGKDAGLGAGVETALKLVADLDREFSGPASAPAPLAFAAAPAPASAPEFFKQDEAVFEPAPAVKPPSPAPKPEPAAENSTRGAKLVIKRVAPAAAAEAPAAAPTLMETIATEEAPAPQAAIEPAPAPLAVEPPALQQAAPAPEEAEIPQSRIVIIRRKAEDLTDVPLLGPESTEPASAA